MHRNVCKDWIRIYNAGFSQLTISDGICIIKPVLNFLRFLKLTSRTEWNDRERMDSKERTVQR